MPVTTYAELGQTLYAANDPARRLLANVLEDARYAWKTAYILLHTETERPYRWRYEFDKQDSNLRRLIERIANVVTTDGHPVNVDAVWDDFIATYANTDY